MKFRYRVTCDEPLFSWDNPLITIQHHCSFFGIRFWVPFHNTTLHRVLLYFNHDAKIDTAEAVYNELKKYGSMKELMAKCITELVKNELKEKDIQQQLKEFILADNKGWTTVEVKENEANGRNSSW